jgi:hypothetical protein
MARLTTFGEQAIGSETMLSHEYAEGFVEGALDVFKAEF